MASTGPAPGAPLAKMHAGVGAICVALLLMSVGLPAMADTMQDCREDCGTACRLFAQATCRSITTFVCPTKELCEAKVIQPCGATCYTGCTTGVVPNTACP
ncbi:hypothetical protein SEVIR_8G037700v4 [Setaria viridis]|uniref:Bifunctional inhibitor/plant lipid transfer protein/seed storage helical domain-containing protein n=1 Tax=Setaria viridis TaxID=4556 RepID=A0A4U6TEY9_SETVI|nr:hypothetical protein SEVIR_8G037700v2 [Setaria viridis]